MNRILSFALLLSTLLPLTLMHPAAFAGSPANDPLPSPETPPPVVEPDDPSLGGILFPHIHVVGVLGDSTTDPVDLAVGHHDPDRSGISLQSAEAGFSLRYGEYLEGFAVGTTRLDQDDEFDSELEEAFLKLKNLPGGFELRGGQFLNRFGQHNATHLHAWSFVDTNLVNGLFLGEDGLITIGGDLTWNLPTRQPSALTIAVGVPREHDHDHGHGEEDHDGHAHGDHEHGEAEAGEDALWDHDSVVVSARWLGRFDYNDFHQWTAGLSGAWGENFFGRTTQVYGVDLEYVWRQNGYEAGGNSLRWRNELLVRNVAYDLSEGHDHDHDDHEHTDHDHDDHEHGHHDHADHEDHEHEHGDHEEHEHDEGRRGDDFEVGAYSTVSYGFGERFEASLRGGFVSGINDLGLEERYRVSPALTAWLDSRRNNWVRVQYNYDHGSDFGDEHSIWLQIGVGWGGQEVR